MRNITAANLEAAGYGTQCTAAELTVREPQQQPCYVELGMRTAQDDRLASVYKPDMRHQLQQRNFTIVASFGDQWSDLAGTSAAMASFKLPNPMYYIL